MSIENFPIIINVNQKINWKYLGLDLTNFGTKWVLAHSKWISKSIFILFFLIQKHFPLNVPGLYKGSSVFVIWLFIAVCGCCWSFPNWYYFGRINGKSKQKDFKSNIYPYAILSNYLFWKLKRIRTKKKWTLKIGLDGIGNNNECLAKTQDFSKLIIEVAL